MSGKVHPIDYDEEDGRKLFKIARDFARSRLVDEPDEGPPLVPYEEGVFIERQPGATRWSAQTVKVVVTSLLLLGIALLILATMVPSRTGQLTSGVVLTEMTPREKQTICTQVTVVQTDSDTDEDSSSSLVHTSFIDSNNRLPPGTPPPPPSPPPRPSYPLHSLARRRYNAKAELAERQQLRLALREAWKRNEAMRTDFRRVFRGVRHKLGIPEWGEWRLAMRTLVRAIKGESIRILLMGGSSGTGQGLHKRDDLFLNIIVKDLRIWANNSNVIGLNMAVGATDSGYYALCGSQHLNLENGEPLDIILGEHGVNDPPFGHFMGEDQRHGGVREALTRKVRGFHSRKQLEAAERKARYERGEIELDDIPPEDVEILRRATDSPFYLITGFHGVNKVHPNPWFMGDDLPGVKEMIEYYRLTTVNLRDACVGSQNHDLPDVPPELDHGYLQSDIDGGHPGTFGHFRLAQLTSYYLDQVVELSMRTNQYTEQQFERAYEAQDVRQWRETACVGNMTDAERNSLRREFNFTGAIYTCIPSHEEMAWEKQEAADALVNEKFIRTFLPPSNVDAWAVHPRRFVLSDLKQVVLAPPDDVYRFSSVAPPWPLSSPLQINGTNSTNTTQPPPPPPPVIQPVAVVIPPSPPIAANVTIAPTPPPEYYDLDTLFPLSRLQTYLPRRYLPPLMPVNEGLWFTRAASAGQDWRCHTTVFPQSGPVLKPVGFDWTASSHRFDVTNSVHKLWQWQFYEDTTYPQPWIEQADDHPDAFDQASGGLSVTAALGLPPSSSPTSRIREDRKFAWLNMVDGSAGDILAPLSFDVEVGAGGTIACAYFMGPHLGPITIQLDNQPSSRVSIPESDTHRITSYAKLFEGVAPGHHTIHFLAQGKQFKLIAVIAC